MQVTFSWCGVSFFDTRKHGGIVCILCIFWRGWEYMWVYVRIYAHTRTPHVGYWDVSPGVGMRHLEGPKNPDGLNLGTYVFVYHAVYTVHVCIYMLGGEMTSWTKCLFLEHNFSLSEKEKQTMWTQHHSNLHGFDLHRPSTWIKDTKPLFKVIKSNHHQA